MKKTNSNMNIGKLNSDLTEIKSVLSCPRLYIVEYFSELINKIDIELAAYLAQGPDDQASQIAIENQSLMIEEIRSLEQLSLSKLAENEIDRKFQEHVRASIKDAELKIKSLDATDFERILEIDYEISIVLLEVWQLIFLNRGVRFLSRSHLINYGFISCDEKLEQFGILVVTVDEFIGWKDFTCYQWDGDDDLPKIFTKVDMKNHYLYENLLIQLDDNSPIKLVELGTNQKEQCYIDSLEISFVERDLFRSMNRLVKLCLDQNNLSSLGALAFQGLDSLEEIYLGFNRLTYLEPNLFRSLKKLKFICLRRNQLIDLDPDIFKGLENLKLINLNDNQLVSINSRTFQYLNSLEQIHLSRNRISFLEMDLFRGLNKLRGIDVDGNQLTWLCQATFQDLESLVYLQVKENPLSDKNFNLIKKFFDNKSILLI